MSNNQIELQEAGYYVQKDQFMERHGGGKEHGIKEIYEGDYLENLHGVRK